MPRANGKVVRLFELGPVENVAYMEEDYDTQDDWNIAYPRLRWDTASEEAWKLPAVVNIHISSQYELIAVVLDKRKTKVIGAVYGGVRDSENEAHFGIDVIVLPAYRRLGAAKALIEEGIAHYGQLAWDYDEAYGKPLIFEVEVVNPVLVPYFKKKGFRVVKETHGRSFMQKNPLWGR
jgi:GNAT superfamily N-acetyltransferase